VRTDLVCTEGIITESGDEEAGGGGIAEDGDVERLVELEAKNCMEADKWKRLEEVKSEEVRLKLSLEAESKKSLLAELKRSLEADLKKSLHTELKMSLKADLKKSLHTELKISLEADLKKSLHTELKMSPEAELKMLVEVVEWKKLVEANLKKILDAELGKLETR
jgi:membrane protein involved in colicin uptake